MPTLPTKPLLMFSPEHWGQVEIFRQFYSQTYRFDERQQRELSGVSAHFDKAARLRRLADKLRGSLEIDNDQLEREGYTPAENAAEVATIIEAAILELYSTVDCTAKVLRTIYGQRVGGRKGSTRTLFVELQKQDADLEVAPVPPPIAALIAEARWYRRLLHLRDELTHTSVGHVRLDSATGVVGYRHYGLKEGGVFFEIPDVYGWLTETADAINHFLGGVFHALNLALADQPVFQMCGMNEGRILFRWVRPIHPISFHSGECGAYNWFEKPGETPCPFRDQCGAYQNKAPPERFGTGGGPTLD